MSRNLENEQILGTNRALALLPGRVAEPQPGSDAALQQKRKKKRADSRTGTRSKPYKRSRVGGSTVKTAFAGSPAFIERLRVYTAALPPSTSRNAWIERVLTQAMDLGIGRSDYAGPK